MMGKIRKVLKIAGDKGEIETEVLLDSGAGVSAVRREIAEKIATIVRRPYPRRFGLADNKSFIETSFTCDLDILMKGKSLDGRFYVVDDLSSPIILGADFMQTWEITLDAKNEDFEIKVDPENIEFAGGWTNDG
jgi:hypothetical protein